MKIPFLKQEDLRRTAVELLSRLNPSGEIPVPIERIVEFDFGIDIVPSPGLIDLRGINGYLTSDRKSIYVDERLFRHGSSRYLFTLAHELSHSILHKDHYETFTSEAEWEAFHAGLEIHSISSAEWQADTLAGLILVPDSSIEDRCKTTVSTIAALVRKSSPDFDLTSEAFWSYAAKELGRVYSVSSDTARIRLQNNLLWCTDPQ